MFVSFLAALGLERSIEEIQIFSGCFVLGDSLSSLPRVRFLPDFLVEHLVIQL